MAVVANSPAFNMLLAKAEKRLETSDAMLVEIRSKKKIARHAEELYIAKSAYAAGVLDTLLWIKNNGRGVPTL